MATAEQDTTPWNKNTSIAPYCAKCLLDFLRLCKHQLFRRSRFHWLFRQRTKLRTFRIPFRLSGKNKNMFNTILKIAGRTRSASHWTATRPLASARREVTCTSPSSETFAPFAREPFVWAFQGSPSNSFLPWKTGNGWIAGSDRCFT